MMNEALNKKHLVSSVIAALIQILILIALSETTDLIIPIVLYIAVGLFLLIGLLSFFYLVKLNKTSPNRFVTAFMGLVGLKMFVAMILAGIYIYNFPEHKAVSGVGIMIVYTIFTVILVTSLLKVLRQSNG